MQTISCLVLLLSVHAAYAQRVLREGLPYKNQVTIRKADGTYIVAALFYNKKKMAIDPSKHYYWFQSDSIRYSQGAYAGRLLHGDYRESYADKSIKITGSYKKGLQDGEWRYLDANGTLRRVANWRRGYEQGLYSLYDTSGNLTEKGHLKKGLKEGVIIVYNTQDSIIKTQTAYRHNLAQEKITFWDRFKLFVGF